MDDARVRTRNDSMTGGGDQVIPDAQSYLPENDTTFMVE